MFQGVAHIIISIILTGAGASYGQAGDSSSETSQTDPSSGVKTDESSNAKPKEDLAVDDTTLVKETIAKLYKERRKAAPDDVALEQMYITYLLDTDEKEQALIALQALAKKHPKDEAIAARLSALDTELHPKPKKKKRKKRKKKS